MNINSGSFDYFKEEMALAICKNIASSICVAEINSSYLNIPVKEIVENSLMMCIPIGELSISIIEMIVKSKECQQLLSIPMYAISENFDINQLLISHQNKIKLYLNKIDETKIKFS